MGERWKPVTNWEGVYEVSNLGGVRRVLANGQTRALKPYQGSKGKGRGDAQYPRVWLSDAKSGRRNQPHRVHLLVWRAFRGGVPGGLEVNHQDLDRSNARLANLNLLTSVQNQAHARAMRATIRRAQSAPTMGMAA